MRFCCLYLFAVILLAACAETPAEAQMVTAESLVTPSPTTLPTDTPVPTLPISESTPEADITLSVWLPESVAPTTNQAARLVLASQMDNFQGSTGGVIVDTRLKKDAGTGSLMTTLLSAGDVAPG
ncbi:MAG: hypothetical protein K8I30_08730, partial [Anaerolineae bacterium]|nr:hypothetical protein [Anaerolineae bacterium]